MTGADIAAAWAEVAEAGRLLGAAGLTPGTTGNVSVRTADGILTSGTGTRLGALGTDDWSLVTDAGAEKGTLKDRVEQVEKFILLEVLREHGNNKTSAAKTLGITREGLHKKLKQLGIA